MFDKKISYVIIAICIIIPCIIGFSLITFVQPKIHFASKIIKVTPSKKDKTYKGHEVRGLEVEIKVESPFGIARDIKVDRHSFREYLSGIEGITVYGGGGFEHGNGLEFEDRVDAELDGITDIDLEKILRNFKYKVQWRDISNKSHIRIFYFTDYIEKSIYKRC